MDFREVTENEDIVEEVVETVEEVVEATGEENDDSNEYEDICYVCRRPESIAGKMISIYGGVKICTDCMQRTMDAMNSSGFGMPPGMSFNMNDFTGAPNGENAEDGNAQLQTSTELAEVAVGKQTVPPLECLLHRLATEVPDGRTRDEQ